MYVYSIMDSSNILLQKEKTIMYVVMYSFFGILIEFRMLTYKKEIHHHIQIKLKIDISTNQNIKSSIFYIQQ